MPARLPSLRPTHRSTHWSMSEAAQPPALRSALSRASIHTTSHMHRTRHSALYTDGATPLAPSCMITLRPPWHAPRWPVARGMAAARPTMLHPTGRWHTCKTALRAARLARQAGEEMAVIEKRKCAPKADAQRPHYRYHTDSNSTPNRPHIDPNSTPIPPPHRPQSRPRYHPTPSTHRPTNRPLNRPNSWHLSLDA